MKTCRPEYGKSCVAPKDHQHRTIRRPLNRVNFLMWFVVMHFLKKKLNQGEICLSLQT